MLLSDLNYTLLEGNALLAFLSTELEQLRSLPQGTHIQKHCPTQKDSLIGLTKSEITIALGEPDFIRSENECCYFFKSPDQSNDWMEIGFGGGFPQLIFVFSGELVSFVECSYSR